MSNLKKVYKSLKYNESAIIDIFCQLYREEYQKDLKNKLENTYFDFSSLPTEEYAYLKKYPDQFNIMEKRKIEQNFLNYKKYVSEAFEGVVRLRLCEEIKRCFGIDAPSQQSPDYDKFVSLFTDENFNSGIIDIYSEMYSKSITTPGLPTSVLESYFRDRMKSQTMLSELKIPLTVFTKDGGKRVDDFIFAREELKNNTFRGFITKYSDYGKRVHKSIKKQYRVDFPETVLSHFIFNEQPEFLNIAANGEILSHVIKVPLATMINHNIECCDLSIIHELIHRMETSGGEIGLSDNGKNIIVNEIRTQKIAVKIVEKMRERGIFLADDPSNKEIIDRSFYIKLFPLFGEFCEKYENILSNIAQNNKGKELENVFGPCWNEFSSLIDHIYYNYDKLLDVSEEKVIARFEKRCQMLIKDMEDYYEKRGKDVRRVVKN